MVYKDGNSLSIINRRNIEISYRYPELLEIVNNIRADSAVLDGEIIVLDKTSGKPDFYKLAEREHATSKVRIEILCKQIPATYVVFDVLFINGVELINKPLLERKKILESLIKENERINLCFYTEDGMKLFEVIKKQKLEGVMGKIKNSLYFPGERKDCWLKIKALNSLDAIICGYTLGEGEREKYFGALLLGAMHEGKLRYIGRVGTGWDKRGLEELTQKLKKIEIEKNPFDVFEEEPSILEKVRWVKPKLVCEVQFLELTEDLKLRAPSFKRLREDKAAEECVLEV